MKFVSREEVIHSLSADVELQETVGRADRTLQEFIRTWNNRKRWQDQFLVTVVARDQGMLRPFGILVKELSDDGVCGVLMRNDDTPNGGAAASCTWSEVIDWRYREMMELRGGDLYRLMYRRASDAEKRQAKERSTMLVNADILLPGQQKSLKLDIARGNNGSWVDRIDELRDQVVTAVVPRHELDFGARNPREHEFSLGQFICLYGDEEGVSLAIAHNLLGPDGDAEESPLEIACLGGNVRTAQVLLDAGYSPIHLSDTGLTPVVCDAAASGSVELVELLVQYDADVNARSADGRSAIYFARTSEIAKCLLSHGARLDVCDDHGNTPLDHALEGERDNVAACLAEQNAPRASNQGENDSHPLSNEQLLTLLASSASEFSDAQRAELEEALRIDYGAILPAKYLADNSRAIQD